MTALEIAAHGFNAACMLLAARDRGSTWWTGMVGCSLFGALFHGSRLYADVVLQCFFVLTRVVGW